MNTVSPTGERGAGTGRVALVPSWSATKGWPPSGATPRGQLEHRDDTLAGQRGGESGATILLCAPEFCSVPSSSEGEKVKNLQGRS